MTIIGHRIVALALAGVLCVGLSRSGVAQMADTADAVSIETVTVTVYRVKEPTKEPIAKSETIGAATPLSGGRGAASHAGGTSYRCAPGRSVLQR